MEIWHTTCAAYHADQSLSQSKIKKFIESPELFYADFVAEKDDVPKKAEPRHFQYGTDLERLLFYDEIPGHLIPDSVLSRKEKDGKVTYDRRGSEWTAYKAVMIEDYGGDVRLYKQEEWNKDILPLLIARDNIRGHAKAKPLIYGEGQPQIALRWVDKETGLPCKAQLDMLHGPIRDPRIIVDVKSARANSPEEFTKAVGNFGYHLQAWFYQEAVRQLTGLKLPFVFVVSHSARPYSCEVYDLSAAWYDSAEFKIKSAMMEIARLYEETKADPSRGESLWHSATHNKVVTLEPKPWQI